MSLGASSLLDRPEGRTLLRLLVYLALISNTNFFIERTSGILSFVLAGTSAVSAILILKDAGESLTRMGGLPIRLGGLGGAALAVGGVVVSLMAIEASLQVLAWQRDPGNAEAARTTLAMPPEWNRRPVSIAGAEFAYYWHGILHVHNRDSIRLAGTFPEKRPGVFRIVALGDSLTYGYGVAAEETYPAVLERELQSHFRVEVLNLGVSGAQSEDIYRILKAKLPVLRPDLVFYGVCLNDFLPSGVGEYASNRAYQVPIPYGDHFVRKTLTGKLFERQYDALLMKLGLREDFFGDILRDFGNYQTRFARDAKAMNAFVLEHGLPAMVAMVLDQYPDTTGRGYMIGQAAERHLGAAGIRVIPAEYIRRNDGRQDWHVSQWEGHPNQKAHRTFAEEVARAVERLPELQAYRR
jgi:hypothetical protein